MLWEVALLAWEERLLNLNNNDNSFNFFISQAQSGRYILGIKKCRYIGLLIVICLFLPSKGTSFRGVEMCDVTWTTFGFGWSVNNYWSSSSVKKHTSIRGWAGRHLSVNLTTTGPGCCAQHLLAQHYTTYLLPIHSLALPTFLLTTIYLRQVITDTFTYINNDDFRTYN